MDMKRTGILAFALVVLVVLVGFTSCYWMGDFSTGGISMDFSGFQARELGDVVRVYLIANGLLFSTDSGVPFTAEVPLAVGDAETIIRIEGLPVGPAYKAMLGIGPVTNGIFQPRAYGETTEFQIASGGDATVVPTIDYLSYFNGLFHSAELQGRNLTGVTAGSFYAYAAEARKLHAVDDLGGIYDSYDLAADPDNFGVASHRINGLSMDSTGDFGDGFINSDQGIARFDYFGEGWNIDPNFSSQLGGDRNIRESNIALPESDFYVFFRRENGLGGTSFLSDEVGSPEIWRWVNLNVDGVRDLVMSGTNAYFATEGGAFALPFDFLLDSPPKFDEKRMNFSGPAEILSLGYLPPATAAGRLLMGTTDGAWEAELAGETPVTIGILTQIPETAGQSIEMISTFENNPTWLQAFLSPYFLYIRKSGTVYRFPFFAVLPGKVTGMTWNSDINARLYISGSEGLSVLYIGSS